MNLRLYEFTFNDNTNLSEDKIRALLKDLLEEEAILQGWEKGYRLYQSKPCRIINGEKEYYFHVEGKYRSDCGNN